MRGYGRADLASDLLAGATTAVLLVPQAMAYAMLAGLPPIAGLYAALAPPLVYAVLGTSRAARRRPGRPRLAAHRRRPRPAGSALASLREFLRELRERRVDLYFADLKGPVRDILARDGLTAELGPDRFSFTADEAVQRATASPVAPPDPRATQAWP